ncbi:exonuclease 1-like [Salvia divinorum]|uniref:Exonuclease 1-like n=1 Tax=Salvia divinorum TaxID=28513 RepID=A0ABD1ICM0_SALDI
MAEGNLDPVSFDHFPKPGYAQSQFPDSIKEEATGSMQEGCFTTVSSHKTAKKRIRVYIPLDAVKGSSEGKQMTVTREEGTAQKRNVSLQKAQFPFQTSVIPSRNRKGMMAIC